MSKYIYEDNGNCTNGDVMYFKADGATAYYEVAKNKHGYARTYQVQGSVISLCRPISWEEEDVTATKEEAIALVKSELKQMLMSTNYNGQFDGLLMAMGEITIPTKELVTEKQLALF